jgi:hypothetical protein
MLLQAAGARLVSIPEKFYRKPAGAVSSMAAALHASVRVYLSIVECGPRELGKAAAG